MQCSWRRLKRSHTPKYAPSHTLAFWLTLTRYGPYVLAFPVASVLPWPAPGTHPDLASSILPVVTLTSLLIWNGPTIAAMLSTTRCEESRGTSTDPEDLPSRAPSRGSVSSPRSFEYPMSRSPDAQQGVVAFLRTWSWVDASNQPWTSTRARPIASCCGLRSDTDRSISLSDNTTSAWAAPPERRYTDPTLVGDSPTYTSGLRSHVNGFHGSRYGPMRPMSPVYMDG